MGEHREFKIYDDCGHTGHGENDPGVVDAGDILGFVCEDAYLYSICYDCHTDDGDCYDASPMGQAWPCDAAKARAHAETLEAALQDAMVVAYELRGELAEKEASVKALERRVETARSLLLDDEWNTSAALRALAEKEDKRAR